MLTQHICISSAYILGMDKIHHKALGMMLSCSCVNKSEVKTNTSTLTTSVPLLNDLLEHKIYACGTVCKSKKKLPLSVKNPGKMQHGTHKTFQLGNTNLVATVWKDNREVQVLSMNSRPDVIVAANHWIGQQQVQVNQPENVAKYNKYMSGVDRHDQMHMHYDVGHFAKKSWKYLMWFFVNGALVNAFILWQQKSTWPTLKWRFMHLDFRKEVACKLIGEFSRKRRCGPQPYIVRAVEARHENVHMESGCLSKWCKWHLMQNKGRRMMAFGCKSPQKISKPPQTDLSNQMWTLSTLCQQ